MTRRVRTWIAATIAIASVAVIPASSQNPATQQTTAPAPQNPSSDPSTPQLKRRDDQIMTIESTTRLVVLDVVVTDAKGHTVKGLQAKDFALTEDGAPQTISSVVEHTSPTPEAAAAEAARMKLPPNTFSNYGQTNDGGYMVFLIDALDNQVQDQMRLRQAMLGYMKTVPYGTKIAIFQLDTQMRMVQGFTTDPAVLLAAVQSKRDSPGFSPVLGNPAAAGAGTVARDPLAGVERGGGEMQNQMKRNRSIILKAGMEELGKYLSGFPGRKSLIWFTGDVPVWVPGGHVGGPAFHDDFTDQTTFIDDMNKTTDVLRLGQIAVYPVDMRGLTLHGGMTSAVQHGTLDDIADATGGKAFYNANGLTQAMAEVADDTSNYYTVSYSPSNKVFDGSYRRLSVTLPAEPLDKLAYRPGYTARSDDYELAQHKAQRKQNRGPLTVAAVGAPPVTALDKSMPLGAAGKRDVLFFAQVNAAPQTQKLGAGDPLPKDNFLAAKYRTAPFRTYQVHFSAKTQTLDLEPGDNATLHGRVEFVTVVYDDQGNVVNSKIAKASIVANNHTYPQLLQNGVELTQTVAVPAKGNFFLRLGVHDVTSDKAGTIEIPVDDVKLGLAVPGPTKR